MSDSPDAATTIVEPDGDGLQPVVLRRGQLTDGWRWLYAVGWSLLIPALMALGDAASSFGKPTWWLDSAGTAAWFSVVPFIGPGLAATAGAVNWRRWPVAAAVGVLGLAGTALADAGRSPAIAIGEGGLALAALATSIAALAGCVR